jgi:copper homeostasis protein
MPFLELACFNYHDAFTVIDLGVDRIEIASQYQGGGITPDLKDLPNLVRNSSVPVHVLIRPRLGNFNYSLEELKIMYDQILEAKEAGASAVVFGCLAPDSTLDVEANSFLLEAAKGIKSTFHRAFDGVVDYNLALQQLIHLKFDAILTSGSTTTAFEGRNTLSQLLDQTKNNLQLICGGGIRSNHIVELMHDTHAEWFHSACFDSQTLQLNKTELKLLKQFIHGHVS